MRIIVFFLISSILTVAAHADRRLTDIRPGVPCDQIAETEQRLGSREATAHNEQSIKRYSGTQGGAKATILYHCNQGRLTEQRVIVSTANREHARRFADEQKTVLTERLGKPLHDGLNLSIWKRFYFGFLGADLDYLTRVVVWGTDKDDTMLMIRETGTDQWEVVISVGSSKVEYILNS